MSIGHRLIAAVPALLLSTVAAAQQPPPGSRYEGPAFQITKIQDDIYHAVGTGRLAVGANAAIIVNESDIMIVDSHISAAAAYALLTELKAISPKPVRYVVNTHFHFDHIHGNQVFPSDVEIIGHEFTRDQIAAGKSKSGRGYDRFVGTLPAQVAALQRRIDTTSVPRVKDSLMTRVAYLKNQIEGDQATVPTVPNVTLNQRMTLYRGGREIRLLFVGRGHTGGDVVVFLPRDRVLASGDLLLAGVPFMGDGYMNEWPATLEQLKALEFDVVLPGHGPAFRGKERIDHLQAFMRDLWTQATTLKQAGVSAEDAARRIDLRSHAGQYPSITAMGVDVDAVRRIYELGTP